MGPVGLSAMLYKRQHPSHNTWVPCISPPRQVGRHFTARELAELLEYDEEGTTLAKDAAEPDDPLLRQLIKQYTPEVLTGYHEHDSLLVDQVRQQHSSMCFRMYWLHVWCNGRSGKLQGASLRMQFLPRRRSPGWMRWNLSLFTSRCGMRARATALV